MVKIWRISVSPSQPGQCLRCGSVNSCAFWRRSCLELNSKMACPPTSSLGSAKGPSREVILPCERRTRVLMAEGARPPVSIMVPALVVSWASLAMASIRAFGGGPACSADFTSIMKRMVGSPEMGDRPGTGRIAAGSAASNYKTNGGRANRQSPIFSLSHFAGRGTQIQRRFLAAIWARRALTIFLMRVGGGGLPVGKWVGALRGGVGFRGAFKLLGARGVGEWPERGG